MTEQQTSSNNLNANGVYGVLPVRAFFVGMHNKPGMEPLDSRTMTGKVIDLIAKRLDRCECVKTNLCDIDYFPKDIVEINKMALEWHKKYQPTQGDIIILLGGWVKKHFWYNNLNVVSITHPAGIYGQTNKKEYITKSVVKIALAGGQHER